MKNLTSLYDNLLILKPSLEKKINMGFISVCEDGGENSQTLLDNNFES